MVYHLKKKIKHNIDHKKHCCGDQILNSESDLFWLTHEQMKIVDLFLPNNKGRKRVNDRRVLSGIIHIRRNNLKWHDAPITYGPYKTLYTRWKRWLNSGAFEQIIDGIKKSYPEQSSMIDSLNWVVLNKSK